MKRLLGLAHVLAVVLVPVIDYRVSSGNWLAFCYVPLLLLASPAFALASYALLPILLLYVRPGGEGFAPFWAYSRVYITALQAFTACQFLLVLAFALDGNLWPETVPGSRRERLLTRHGGAIRGWLVLWCWLLVAAMCFKDTPLYELIVWVAILLSVRRQVPPSEVKTSRRTRVGEVVLGTLSVVLFLVVLEVGARALFETARPDGEYCVADAEALFALEPGAQGKHSFTEGGKAIEVSFEISSQGLRDRFYGPKADDEFRILLLGDSMAMGFATQLEDSLSRVLERQLASAPLKKKITVINGGVVGYGPWQERILLRRRGFPLQPDLVINELFPTNDIDNSLTRVGKRLRAYDSSWHNIICDYVYRNLWQVRLNRWLVRRSRLFERLQSNHGSDALLPYWWNRVRFFPRVAYAKLPPRAPRYPYTEMDLEEWYPELYEGLDLFVNDVKGIEQDCHERGIDYLSFSLPMGTDLIEKSWLRYTRMARDGSRYECGKDIRVVRERLEQEGVPYFDVVDCMRSHMKDTKLYYLGDGHLTPSGCEVVAQCIKDYLIFKYFPTKGMLEWIFRLAP